MTNLFYSHLVYTQEISQKLGKYGLSVTEHEEIMQIVGENTHHRVLDTVLKHLSKEKHEEFIKKLNNGPHQPELMDFLKKEIKDIEKIIVGEAKKIRDEILAEFSRAEK